RMEWVDLDRRVIRVPDTLQFTAKNKAARTIPLDDELATALAAMGRKEGAILISRKSGSHYSYQGTRKLWRQAVAASGVAFSPYDARHTFCSQLIASGVPIPEVQKVMGHRRIETTMKYAHLAPDYLERVRWAIGGGKLKAVK
ncbi:MAG: putative phage integrase, partial [bacterium]